MKRCLLVLFAASLLAPSLPRADNFGPTKPGARASYQAPRSEASPAPRAGTGSAAGPKAVAKSCDCPCRRG